MFQQKGLIAYIEQDKNKAELDMSFAHTNRQQMLNLMNSYKMKPRQTWKRADKLVNDKPAKWAVRCFTKVLYTNPRTQAVTTQTITSVLTVDAKLTLAELRSAINAQRDADIKESGLQFEGFRAECICLSGGSTRRPSRGRGRPTGSADSSLTKGQSNDK